MMGIRRAWSQSNPEDMKHQTSDFELTNNLGPGTYAEGPGGNGRDTRPSNVNPANVPTYRNYKAGGPVCAKRDAVCQMEEMGDSAEGRGDAADSSTGFGTGSSTDRMKKGGPVVGKYTKGTGAVDYAGWKAPQKSKRV